jgi:hypothetical protein
MSIPRNLYHYTDINSLALILANQTIRFSALNNVNDTAEGKSADIGDLGMYIFVSCWTVTKKEYLPIWNMYTPQMRGVRIKLPFPVFNIYKNGEHESLFQDEELVTENHMLLSSGKPYRHVIYTNDPLKLKPKSIRKIDDEYEGIHFDGLGLYKEKIWGFEYELRFRFSAVPKPKTKNINDTFNIGELTKIIDQRVSLGFNFYDLKIADVAFEQMEITLGPKLLPGDKEIVQSLLSNYNPKAKILNSELTGKIR